MTAVVVAIVGRGLLSLKANPARIESVLRSMGPSTRRGVVATDPLLLAGGDLPAQKRRRQGDTPPCRNRFALRCGGGLMVLSTR